MTALMRLPTGELAPALAGATVLGACHGLSPEAFSREVLAQFGRKIEVAILDHILTIETGKTVRRSEISIMHANVPLIIGYSTLMIKNAKGTDLGIAVIFQDISFVSATKK